MCPVYTRRYSRVVPSTSRTAVPGRGAELAGPGQPGGEVGVRAGDVTGARAEPGLVVAESAGRPAEWSCQDRADVVLLDLVADAVGARAGAGGEGLVDGLGAAADDGGTAGPAPSRRAVPRAATRAVTVVRTRMVPPGVAGREVRGAVSAAVPWVPAPSPSGTPVPGSVAVSQPVLLPSPTTSTAHRTRALRPSSHTARSTVSSDSRRACPMTAWSPAASSRTTSPLATSRTATWRVPRPPGSGPRTSSRLPSGLKPRDVGIGVRSHRRGRRAGPPARGPGRRRPDLDAGRRTRRHHADDGAARVGRPHRSVPAPSGGPVRAGQQVRRASAVGGWSDLDRDHEPPVGEETRPGSKRYAASSGADQPSDVSDGRTTRRPSSWARYPGTAARRDDRAVADGVDRRRPRSIEHVESRVVGVADGDRLGPVLDRDLWRRPAAGRRARRSGGRRRRRASRRGAPRRLPGRPA